MPLIDEPGPVHKRPRRRTILEPPVDDAFAPVEWDALAVKVSAFFDQLEILPAGYFKNGFVYLPSHPTMESQSSDRFVATRDGDTYAILHRQLADDIIVEIQRLAESPVEGNNRLYVHGAQGVGKSHSLYEAVCHVMRDRASWRVVYMNDCKAWLAGSSLSMLTEHIAMGFHPVKDRMIWESCKSARTYHDVYNLLFTVIPQYCVNNGLKFAFVFDQHNGLTATQRKEFPYVLLETDMCHNTSWKRVGVLVISASANNEYQLEMIGKESFNRVDVFEGFDDEQLKLWSLRHDMFVDDKDWESVTALVNNWPLALGAMTKEFHNNKIAGRTVTLLELLSAFEGRIGVKLVPREQEHFLAIMKRPDVDMATEAYRNMIFQMLIRAKGNEVQRVYNASVLLMNRHLMYWDTKEIMFRPIHELARQIFVDRRYVSLQTVLTDGTVMEMLQSPRNTHSVKGSMVELYTILCAETLVAKNGELTFSITSIDKPGRKHNIAFRPQRYQTFKTQSVPAGLDFTVPTVLVPQNSNYPGIDMLLLDIKNRTKTLYAIQFTVGPIKDHALPDDDLLKTWADTSAAKLAYVWATPPEAYSVSGDNAGHFHCNLVDLKFAPLLQYYKH